MSIDTPFTSNTSVDSTKSTPSSLLKSLKQKAAGGFVQKWEQSSPLTQPELDAIARVSLHMKEKPMPEHLVDDLGESVRTASTSSGNDSNQPEFVLHTVAMEERQVSNMMQFYQWFNELEGGELTELEMSFHDEVARLRLFRDTCDALYVQLDGALCDLKEIEGQYLLVSTKTGELHQACEELLEDQQRLVKFADGLRSNLSYFNELEESRRRISAPGSVTDENFRLLLERLDEAIAFMEKNENFKDARVYLTKFKVLQNRALCMVKDHVVKTLTTAAATVSEQIKSEKGNFLLPGTGATEASVFYVKFKALAPRIKPLSAEIELRAGRSGEYKVLLDDCQEHYFAQRQLLLHDVIEANISEFGRDIHTLARSGCAYLIRICELESNLYKFFFNVPSEGLKALIRDFSNTLYETIRTLVLQSKDVDTLSTLSHILNREVLLEQVRPRGSILAPFEPVVTRLLEDTRERLIYIAELYVRSAIGNYTPSTPLDYPEVIIECEKKQRAGDAAITFYSTWHPVLHRTLTLLSKLYLALDKSVFEGIAHDAVQHCVRQLKLISNALTEQKGDVNGLLFLLRHLQILRVQISPFDADIAVTESSVDFSYVREVLSDVVKGRTSVTTLFQPPRLLDTRLDSQKDLEQTLRKCTERYILLLTRAVLDPMISFQTKSVAFINVKGSSSSAEDKLSKQAFASCDKVAALVGEVQKRLHGENFQNHVNLTAIYLSSAKSDAVIFKQVAANIMDSFAKFHSLINGHYTADERLKMGVMSLNDIETDLNKMFAKEEEKDEQ